MATAADAGREDEEEKDLDAESNCMRRRRLDRNRRASLIRKKWGCE